MGRSRSRMGHRAALVIAAVAVSGLLSIGVGAGAARTDSQSDRLKISMLITNNSKPAWEVLIPSFERAYPNLGVDINYAKDNTSLSQLETTELAGGNAPDILTASPGCGTSIAICTLAKAGYLAGMPNKPWAKKTRAVPLVTGYSKYGQRLFGFVPQVAPTGIFTNDSMFRQRALKIPRTFSQLLDVCRKAKANGTAAMIAAGGTSTGLTFLIETFALPTLYAKDKKWNAKMKAGKVTFAGSRAWRQALQHFVDMNNAGCFHQGALATSSGTVAAQLFAQGQGLMLFSSSNNEGTIEVNEPQFSYTFHVFPAGTSPTQTTTLITLLQALSVNARSSAEHQAAAQTFIDFIGRPQQNALFTRLTGGLSQYQLKQSQLKKGQLPSLLSSFKTVFDKQRYVINPVASWWNPSTVLALQDNQIGLITGQRSIDEVLKKMDAAWKIGPS